MLTRSDVQPGVFIGNYKLLARISSVGMASVWLAELGKDDDAKLVLVKTLRPRSPEDGLRAKAFLAEATVASTLAHPNVMQVSDFGEAEGRYFLATEFFPGRTLRQIGRRARKSNQQIDLRFLLRVGIDVCSALSYLHAFDDGSGSRHVHLEVRPENIMVAFSGLVKLVDLGVRAAGAGSDRAGSRYLAPERVDSSEPSPTWDTYALGVVLYEHATGVFPFDGRQASPAATRSGGGPPLPPSVHNAAIARPLSDIILRSIAVDPTERYQSAASLARALNGYLAQFEPEGLNFSLDSYVSELFPGEASAQVKAVARLSSVQGESPIPPVFWNQVESPKNRAPASESASGRAHRVSATAAAPGLGTATVAETPPEGEGRGRPFGRAFGRPFGRAVRARRPGRRGH